MMTDSVKKNTAAVREIVINFLVPLVAFLIIGVLVLFIGYPFYRDYPRMQADLSQKQELKATLQTKITNLTKLVDFKSAVDQNSGLVDRVLVSDPNVPQLLDETFQIATNAGEKVTKLSYAYSTNAGIDSSPSSVQNIDVTLSTQGNYAQMISMLQNFENAARVITVNTFRFSRQELENNADVLSVNAALTSPYYKVESAAVTDDPVTIDITSPDFVSFINKIKSLKYYEFTNTGISEINPEPKKEDTAKVEGVNTLESSSSTN